MISDENHVFRKVYAYGQTFFEPLSEPAIAIVKAIGPKGTKLNGAKFSLLSEYLSLVDASVIIINEGEPW